MPPARRFLSYILGASLDEQFCGRTVPADVEAPANAGLFSTFAIYQGQNQLGLIQMPPAIIHTSSETISSSSS
jgi:hypothetical protein